MPYPAAQLRYGKCLLVTPPAQRGFFLCRKFLTSNLRDLFDYILYHLGASFLTSVGSCQQQPANFSLTLCPLLCQVLLNVNTFALQFFNCWSNLLITPESNLHKEYPNQYICKAQESDYFHCNAVINEPSH